MNAINCPLSSKGAGRRFSLPPRASVATALTLIFAFFFISIHEISNYGMSWDEPFARRRAGDTRFFLHNLLSGQGDTPFDPGPWHYHPPFYATLESLMASIGKSAFNLNRVSAGHLL